MNAETTANTRIIALALMSVALGFASPELSAQSNPVYVPFQNGVAGALYKPDSGPPPHVGIVVMHREGNFMRHISCTEFSKRGFLVLCMNSRFVNNESSVEWELIPLDVAQGVNYLKNVQRMTKIVLFGNSGGGITMSFYQAVAENGPAVCQGPSKLMPCGNNLAGLAPADGIILVDGHPGNPIMRLRSLNPSVIDEFNPARRDPALDPFDPKNGYSASGASKYSEDFKRKYFEAQAERMNRLIALAQKQWQEIQSGKGPYPDDAPFNSAGFDGARLLSLDLSIRHTTARPAKFLKNDGTIVTEIVPSIAPARPELAKANRTFHEGTQGGLTLKSFLSSNAIRATDSMDERKMDLCSTNNSTPCMLQNVTAPVLIAAMQASFQNLVQDMEVNYSYAKSKDKDFIVVEGATTNITPCANCGGSREQYSNATKNFFDYAAKWISARF
jgi:hypothetical protein